MHFMSRNNFQFQTPSLQVKFVCVEERQTKIKFPLRFKELKKRPDSIEMFKTLAEKRRATSWTDTSLLKLFSFKFHGKKPCSLERQFLHIFTFKSSGTYMSVAADSLTGAASQNTSVFRFSHHYIDRLLLL
jgi:hypothetical protein